MAEFYVCHDREKFRLWRRNVPEVFHFDQMAPTILTEAWQRFIYELNHGGEYGWMTPNSFHGLFLWNKAFSNRNAGFDFFGLPKADFIKQTNLRFKPPRLDKCRICGGATIHGKLNGDLLTVETLDGSKKPPSVEWLLERPWLFFRCYTVLPDGSNADFPNNQGKPVLMPLVATGSVTVRIDKNVPKKPYPLVRIK